MATNNSINANSTTPLTIVDGGTQVTSVTIAPTATAFSGWDANKNLSAVNHIEGYATTVSSASPIVLVVGSAYAQYITGSTAQTVTLPVTSTLATVASGTAQSFLIVNNSSNTTTVNSSGGNLVETLGAGSQGVFTCISNSGTTAASWASDFVLNVAGVASITGTTNQVIASSATGAVTLSTPQDINTTSNVTFGSVNKVTITAPATSSTLTVANGKTFTASNTLTLTGTDTSSINLGTGGVAGFLTSGTWTPVLNFGGATTGITYTTQAANYTYVRSSTGGGVLTFNVNIVLSSKGSATGAATVTGLPVASLSTSIHIFDVTQSAITYTGAIKATLNSAASILNIQNLVSSTGEATILDTAFTNSSVLRISGSYLIASG